jgi:hypothetical protein
MEDEEVRPLVAGPTMLGVGVVESLCGGNEGGVTLFTGSVE